MSFKNCFLACVVVLALLSLQLPLFGDQVLKTDLTGVLSRFIETNPPTGPVRPVSEFDPASQVMIRYPLGIPVSLVAQLSNTLQVLTIVSSTSVQNQAVTAFNSGGVNMANVAFMIAATESYWTRDYGPLFIFDGNDNLSVVDFQYNRPRPNDNMIPQIFAGQSSLTYYGMNLQQTGGNYMTDGINTAAQTMIAYTENSSLTQAQVNAKMQAYLGITSYHVLPDPNNTYIDHIDCWGKFLAPDKVLIRSVPTTHAQYSAIEQTANYFANLNCAWGYPYKVYRVNTPQNQPYTNSYIVNRKVFVPIMNSTNDAAALQVYRTALPGYEVIGVAGPSSAPWESTDALHCRVHEIPDGQMLHITHNPHWGTHPLSAGFDFAVRIKAYSNTALFSDSLFVSYKINSGAWLRANLINIAGNNFNTMVGGFAPGDTIRYFVHAADQSGRSTDHPFTGARDPHRFIIAPDAVPPTIEHVPPVASMVQQSEPVTFSAIVNDNFGISQVIFRYRVDAAAPISVSMNETQTGIWSFDYYPEFVTGDVAFYYQIIAYDNSTPPNTMVYPSGDQWQMIPIDTVSGDDQSSPPISSAFLALYPNPFRGTKDSHVNLDYKSHRNDEIMLKVFNIRGQLVYQHNTRAVFNGVNRILWNSRDNNGKVLSPGIYILNLRLGDKSYSRKMIIGN
ncbi:MAG: agmatine deiminase family protein [Candidatus Cloacimonadaceae bacterium]|nr:agmatine deiminase family protein [Candidatus Cloacimonadaceae bacterium]MDP3113904.1 agmatine deiminase family protein [Candidatus Cloacimonadaceae bacterium]